MNGGLSEIRCVVLSVARPGRDPYWRLAVAVPSTEEPGRLVRTKSARYSYRDHARLRASASKGFRAWVEGLPASVRPWVLGLPLLVQGEFHRAYEAL